MQTITIDGEKGSGKSKKIKALIAKFKEEGKTVIVQEFNNENNTKAGILVKNPDILIIEKTT